MMNNMVLRLLFGTGLVAILSCNLLASSPDDDTPLAKDFINSIGMKFRLIPAGEFMMGSPEDDENRFRDEKQHQVRIAKPYYFGVYEVTQEQYERIMGNNPSKFKGSTNPVENVTWDEAVEFCKKLSAEEGRSYRLPTEAEWEYACRAGKTTPFYFGSSIHSKQANFNGNYPIGAKKGPFLKRTITVGSYAPNAFGLYDMHGNVWEWCSDWYGQGYYEKSPTVNPTGPASGSKRLNRGGGWESNAQFCRLTCRHRYVSSYREPDLGFRVVLVPSK
jgi:formylglycine-generating enzyme required for sulfatase activity